MFVTRRPRGAKPQVKGAQGPDGRTHFESVRAGTWRLHSHISLEEDPVPESGGNREELPADHVDGRSAIHHLQTDLIKSVEAPLHPYIRIPMVEFTHTTLFL
jgi:hypothetical protein